MMIETEYVFHVWKDDDIVKCKVGGIIITMLIDSGTKCNIIDNETWEHLKKSGVKVTNQIKI